MTKATTTMEEKTKFSDQPPAEDMGAEGEVEDVSDDAVFGNFTEGGPNYRDVSYKHTMEYTSLS